MSTIKRGEKGKKIKKMDEQKSVHMSDNSSEGSVKRLGLLVVCLLEAVSRILEDTDVR